MSDKITMVDLKKQLLEELENNKAEILANPDYQDLISEFVDRYVPVYHYKFLELAMDDLWLATITPEIYAFDGTHTAINAIAGNVYQELQEEAQNWLNTAKEEAGND